MTDHGQVVGVLHRRDVKSAALYTAASVLTEMTARDLMHPPRGVVLAGVPMRDAVMRMLEMDVHGLPVVGGDGQLLGVVTISDVLKTLLGAPTTGPSVHSA